MYQKTEVKTEPLTLELAKEISTMPGLPGERALRPTRVQFLENHLRQQSFVGPSWAIASCRDTQDRYRINGQHSSHLLAKLPPDAFPKGLLVTIDVYEFDSLDEDSAGLFNLFDHPRSARTDSDYMGIHRARYSDLSEIENPFLIKATNGIAFREKSKKQPEGAEQFTTRGTISHRDHGLYLAEDRYRQFVLWLYRWRESRNANFINRSGIVSEILDDWEYDAVLATEYWAYVFEGSHPDPNHETREFVDAVKDMIPKAKSKQADFQKRAKRSWNRFRKIREAEIKIGKKAEKKDDAETAAPADTPLFPPAVPSPAEVRPQV